MFTIKDFLDVYSGLEKITVKVDYICDFEEVEINVLNYSERKKELGDLKIKDIDISWSLDGKGHIYIETLPLEIKD